MRLNVFCKGDTLEWNGMIMNAQLVREMILLRAERTVTSAFGGIFALVVGGLDWTVSEDRGDFWIEETWFVGAHCTRSLAQCVLEKLQIMLIIALEKLH